jgi:HD-GYP domain-containing protein (c-di-GMP phosphodiesterase class II)
MKIIQSKIKTTISHAVLDIDSLQVGEVLVFDVYVKRDRNYFIVIEKGTLFTLELQDKLKKQDRLYIKREDVKKEKLTCESLDDYIKINKNEVEKILGFLYKINEGIFENYFKSQKDQISLDCVYLLVESMIKLIKKDKKYLQSVISRFTNEYDLKMHSLHVSIYSISIGLSLNFDSKKLIKLGVAGLLHDIGHKKIDIKILQKRGVLLRAETMLVQKHPLYSVEVLKRNNISDSDIISGVMYHHENENGKGYPSGLSSKNINDFAAIISIADVFDALTNMRPHREAYNSFKALSIMMKDESMAGKFKHQYLELFLKSLKT